MIEIDRTNAASYLAGKGWIADRDPAVTVEELSGGVSNVVLLVSGRSAGAGFVLKQSREKLRVAADWRSRLDRIWREVAALKLLDDRVPGAVPRVLFEDRENYLFTMTAAGREHRVWKRDLLAGKFEPSILNRLAIFLAEVHRSTWNGDGVPELLHDRDVFDELRLDPYYRWTATQIPAAEKPLRDLVEETLSHSDCLTLADFSPKNILLDGNQLTIIDFETAHLGDPAFDLGFFLSHLFLKSLHVLAMQDEFLAGIRSFWATYAAALHACISKAELEPRVCRHLAACLLARVDGKSPVDYLTPDEQQTVRGIAIEALTTGYESLDQFEQRFTGQAK
jgi:aminoglycoside phosphotransferase (APT) family kinase protein